MLPDAVGYKKAAVLAGLLLLRPFQTVLLWLMLHGNVNRHDYVMLSVSGAMVKLTDTVK